MRVGLFGGSFNPIHNGHLHLARSVKEECGLEQVLLMPTGTPPHKSAAEYADAHHRLAMCRLAAAPYDWMTVSDDEIKKNGKSYTVETLRDLHQQRPDVQWTLMIGSDMLMTFDSWYCWQEILSLADVCAVSRNGADAPFLRQKAWALSLAAGLPLTEPRIRVLSVPPFPISSTQIRAKVQKNENCSCLLPENVVQYMDENGLYRVLK